jgi:hypothetical protein
LGTEKKVFEFEAAVNEHKAANSNQVIFMHNGELEAHEVYATPSTTRNRRISING